MSGVCTTTSLTTVIIKYFGVPSPYPAFDGTTYPLYIPTPELNILLLIVNEPASDLSVRVVLFNLNVIVSAFSESYPKFIFVGLAILYLNEFPLKVTLGTVIGTTFL